MTTARRNQHTAVPGSVHMLENQMQYHKRPVTRSTSTVVVAAGLAFPVQLFFAGAEFPFLEAAHTLSTGLAPVQ